MVVVRVRICRIIRQRDSKGLVSIRLWIGRIIRIRTCIALLIEIIGNDDIRNLVVLQLDLTSLLPIICLAARDTDRIVSGRLRIEVAIRLAAIDRDFDRDRRDLELMGAVLQDVVIVVGVQDRVRIIICRRGFVALTCRDRLDFHLIRRLAVCHDIIGYRNFTLLETIDILGFSRPSSITLDIRIFVDLRSCICGGSIFLIDFLQ